MSGKRSASEIEQIIAGILLVVTTAAIVQAITLIWPIGGT